jgi:glycosyltransferase involved in cell wall biosynthesis
VPFAAIPYRRTPSRQEHRVELALASEAPFETNVICLNADYLNAFLDDVGVRFFANRYSIGVWFWESNVFRSRDLDALRFLDEVWVASEYVRRAVAAQADVPVHVVPLPVEGRATPSRTRAALGLPEGFMFLFLFDFVSVQRKNPQAIVEAFTRAFEPGEGPILVLKSINGRERKPRHLDELVAATTGRPDVHVLDGYLSAEERDAMLGACDCYVSLHRSEGFGLTMAEAMAYGKPVIATAYSGNVEFMHESGAYLVPYRLVPIPEDWWAYAPGAEWADPDVGAASALMRHVYEHPSEAAERGARGRMDILRDFSLERAAQFVAGRLGEARATSGHDVRSPLLRASAELSKGVGAGLASRGRSAPTAIVRRLLRRLLWPELARAQEVDAALLDAIRALERSRRDELERLSRLEASLGAAGDEAGSGEPPH